MPHSPMNSVPEISIIIVNYNGGQWLARSIASVAAQTLKNFECFIVDNGSTDGSLDTLSKLDTRFNIIKSETNLGFAAGNNLAAKKSRGNWLAMLNPDAFARENWLENLIKATTLSPQVTMVGSTQFMALDPNTYDGTGDFYHISGLAWRGKHGHMVTSSDNKSDLKTAEVFGPCAAAALYHRETFLSLGGFDERFFCYHEDVDLAFRMRLAGGICIQSHTAIVDHVSSGITGKASTFAVYHGTRNRIWTFVKNMPALGLWIFGPLHIVLNIAFMIWSLFRPGRAQPTWRGIWHGVKAIPDIWQSRANIHPARKLGLFALMRVMSISPLTFLRRDHAPVPIQQKD